MRALAGTSPVATLVLCLTVTLTACVSYPGGESAAVQAGAVDRSLLLEGAAFGVQPGDSLPPVSLLGLNPEMREFLQEHVPAGASKQLKVRRILQALLDDGLDLHYDNFQTHTAEQTFRFRDGNCMSFTNLFIALAREAGLTVSYQEVEVPPSWAQRGESWLYSKHINALVKLVDTDQVVDFNLGEFNEDYPRRRLTDREALARYHNNMGAHWMGEGDLKTAFMHFREALRLDPDTSYFWTNVGSLYRRGDLQSEAEQAFLVAIAMDGEPVAMSNLARLYREQGRVELAGLYAERVQSFRMQNPFYLYHLAAEAYAGAEFGEAERLLRRAIRLNGDEHEFHRLLGLTYIHEGRVGAAKREFRQAAELARDPESQSRYRRKLELLADR